MTTHRTIRIGIGLIGLAAGLTAACNFTLSVRLPKRADASSAQKVPLPVGAAIISSNDVGNTRVAVDPAATEATVEITRIALADTQAEADDLLRKIIVTVTPPSDSDNALHISAPQPPEATGSESNFHLEVTEDADNISVVTVTSTTRVAQVDLRITVPPGHPFDVTQDVGGIRAVGLETESKLATRNGSIRSIGAAAKMTAVSQSGGITISGHRGSVDLTNRSGSTGITILRLANTDSVVARSTSGRIELTLPSTVDADLFAITESGSISFRRSDFDDASHVDRASDTLSAILNDGGAVIDLRAESGSIEIRSP